MKTNYFKKTLKYFIIGFFIGVIIFVSALFYGNLFSIVGFINALTISTILLFAVGWFLFISNVGALDILFYGVQAFTRALIGKRMKSSYYDYTANKEQIPNKVLFGFWLAFLLYLLALIVLYVIYLQTT